MTQADNTPQHIGLLQTTLRQPLQLRDTNQVCARQKIDEILSYVVYFVISTLAPAHVNVSKTMQCVKRPASQKKQLQYCG